MFKVMIIVGTRPELIKMSRVIAEFDRHTALTLVHTGQNYDYTLNQIFFDEMEIRKPDYFLDASGDTAVKTIANVLVKADEVMKIVEPDALLLYGDTNSCLSVIAAKKRRIPIFHMEAGNRCFDERVPEELNRKIIDHLSDINIVLTEHARHYLHAEGISPERIIKSGSHLPEVLNYYQGQIKASKILEKLKLDAKAYFLISAHREENVDNVQVLSELLKTLEQMAEIYQCPIVFSTHPRTRKRIEALGEQKLNPLIRFLEPFGFFDYVQLQLNARCVLSDSGTLTEESAILGFPAINLRTAHERPEGMDAGVLIMSGLSPEKVSAALAIALERQELGQLCPEVCDYADSSVARKILNIVLSYSDYINRVVWFKQ